MAPKKRRNITVHDPDSNTHIPRPLQAYRNDAPHSMRVDAPILRPSQSSVTTPVHTGFIPIRNIGTVWHEAIEREIKMNRDAAAQRSSGSAFGSWTIDYHGIDPHAFAMLHGHRWDSEFMKKLRKELYRRDRIANRTSAANRTMSKRKRAGSKRHPSFVTNRGDYLEFFRRITIESRKGQW